MSHKMLVLGGLTMMSLAIASCGSKSAKDSQSSLAAANTSYKFATIVSERYIRFVVDASGNRAMFSTNDAIGVNSISMELIGGVETYWPPVAGQEIPVKLHVGWTTGPCFHPASFEITAVKPSAYPGQIGTIEGMWKYPDYVNSNCQGSGKNYQTRAFHHVIK